MTATSTTTSLLTSSLPSSSSPRSRTRTRTRTRTHSNHHPINTTPRHPMDITTLFHSDSPFFFHPVSPHPHLHPVTASRPGESPQIHNTPTFTSGFSPRLSGPVGISSPARQRRFGGGGGGGPTSVGIGMSTTAMGLFGDGAALEPASEIVSPASSSSGERSEGEREMDRTSRILLQEEMDSLLDTPVQAHHHPLSVRFKTTTATSFERADRKGASVNKNQSRLPSGFTGKGALVQGGFDAVVFVLFWISVVVFFSALCGVGGAEGSEVMRARVIGGGGGLPMMGEVGRKMASIGVVGEGEIILDGFEPLDGIETDLSEGGARLAQVMGGGGGVVKHGTGRGRGRGRAAAKAFFGRFGGVGGPRAYGWDEARM